MSVHSKSPLAGIKALADACSRSARHLIASATTFAESADCEPLEASAVLRQMHEELIVVWREATTVLQAVADSSDVARAISMDSYAQRLLAALNDAGLSWIGDPTLPVIDGKAFVEVDVAAPTVRINGRLLGDLRVTAVVAEITRTLAGIAKNATAPDVFLAGLERAYEMELVATGANAGSQVNLGAVHLRLLIARQTKAFRGNPQAATFREYPMEVFRGDLYDALKSSERTPKGRMAQIVSGSDTQGAIFMILPGTNRPTHAGRLSLVSESE